MKLSFKAVDGHDKYLGLPTYIGDSKKQVFQIVQDRVWKKLKGWREKFHSQAGREVLIKSIAQAIPTYAMQCFLLPVSILDEIKKLCRNFFWGQKKDERKMSWVAWEKFYAPKSHGGLGFQDMRNLNRALLAKQAWRIMTNEDSLMSKVLKGKYFPNSSFLEAKISPNMSYTWRSILGARDVLEMGARKVVGDGTTTLIRKDPWIPSLPNFKNSTIIWG
ncbi:uncharacterized protein LOC110691788 [Chenopodium quinoa]|uniref:uncharacterized protein LOC110691788 n=1 Tax=Chenopodium quinoa TaxID=63459 RepID=UPI000B76E4B8|nr:uncharacterized protein LOC110691788 [Chenopodium quinoa]